MTQIVAAVVQIIDTEGLDALTMRRLANELGVAAMTVYSYVRGKDELLDLVIDHVAAAIPVPPPSGPWRERARALAHSLRDALLAHPEGARLINQRPMLSPNAFRLFDAGLGIFRDAGFPDDQAAHAYFAFGNYIMGCVAQDTTGVHPAKAPDAGPHKPGGYLGQLPPDQFPNVHALAPYIYGHDESTDASGACPDGAGGGDTARRRFDFGLDSLLDGLATRLPSQASTPLS